MALGVALASASAWGADYKTLRNLRATAPPTSVTPLSPGASVRPVQFARIVIHPRDGEPWAIAYQFVPLTIERPGSANNTMLTWESGRIEGDKSSFERAFDEELAKAGFKTESSSTLFGDVPETGSADLKIGVLIDEMQGRYCVNCPNIYTGKTAPATVLMTARWEIYDSLERRVVAKVTTTGGADFQNAVRDSVLPPVLEAFRENLRMLLASDDFRKLVVTPVMASRTKLSEVAGAPIVLLGPQSTGTLADATKSVAIVFAADGSGSGFLVSKDGYVLTNHHVVGGAKYVKLKWSTGEETLGEVVRSDRRRDVALIKTDAKGRAPLALRSDAPQLGDPVFAIGTPLDDKLQNTLTKGIVSANRVYDGQPFIQSDVAVTHGNSGGPLLDEKGRVLGLTVSGRAPEGAPVGLNFFIPIDDALRALALKSAG
jgi:S1-C subfamily serine protease